MQVAEVKIAVENGCIERPHIDCLFVAIDLLRETLKDYKNLNDNRMFDILQKTRR